MTGPQPALCCPFCGSGDVDEAARTCRACGTAVPMGATLRPSRKRRVGTKAARTSGAATQSLNFNNDSAKRWRR